MIISLISKVLGLKVFEYIFYIYKLDIFLEYISCFFYWIIIMYYTFTPSSKFYLWILWLIISTFNYFYLKNNFYEKLKNENVFIKNNDHYKF